MSEPALRAFALAGVLTASLLIGGFAATPVLAQPADSGGSSQDSGDTSGGASGGTDSGTGPTAASKPNETAGTTVVASGTSCRHQIDHLTDIKPVHMAELLAEALSTERS